MRYQVSTCGALKACACEIWSGFSRGIIIIARTLGNNRGGRFHALLLAVGLRALWAAPFHARYNRGIGAQSAAGTPSTCRSTRLCARGGLYERHDRFV